jgi:hypothetical protein
MHSTVPIWIYIYGTMLLAAFLAIIAAFVWRAKRFSLASVLIAMTVICLVLGIVGAIKN